MVLDGVTAPADLGTGCVHGVAWFVDQLGAALLRYGGSGSLSEALQAAICAVCEAHPKCDVAHPGMPSATMVMRRWGADSVDWLVLRDRTLVVELADGDIAVVRGDSLNKVAVAERAATSRRPLGSAAHADAVQAMIVEQRAWRNCEGGIG